ncbi:hypothetical protein M5D96_005949 [Drosophila gunungcola]|uniref:Uncharacterized protein n=1 Tax=Drosophila gunungcola TaxID=103775 RepID=A0A9P9YS54_9MUSC|nr:hypothetical protein M5D96_005949 [Drosophila gunungcola]
MNTPVWFPFCATLFIVLQQTITQDVHSRSKRFLIFPRQAPTRHQFIAGIGIPADLEYESLTVGYVLKAEYYLPYNASVYRQNPLFPEYKPNKIDAEKQREFFKKPTYLRWQMYDFIEHMLNGPSSTLNSDSKQARDFILAEKEGARMNCAKYDCNTKIIDWFSFVRKLDF